MIMIHTTRKTAGNHSIPPRYYCIFAYAPRMDKALMMMMMMMSRLGENHSVVLEVVGVQKVVAQLCSYEQLGYCMWIDRFFYFHVKCK